MKKNPFVMLLATGALLASCGGAPTPSSSSSGTGSTSSSSSAASDEVTVSFWSTGSQAMTTQLQTLATKFEQAIKKNTGVTVHMEVTVEGSYDDIADKIDKGLATGTIPNMAVAYPDTVANILSKEPANKHYLYDITSYMDDAEIGFTKQSYLGDIAAADKEDIVEAFFEEGTQYDREGMYSYPFMKSSEVMFYNVNDVERAYKFCKPSVVGKDNIRRDLASMSWTEFEDFLGLVMDNKDKILSTLKHAAWYDSDSNWFITQMYQREIGYTSIKDGKGAIDFETGEPRTKTEAMLNSFKELHDDDRITTKNLENGAYGSTAFTKGEVLFEIGSSGGTGYNMPEGLEPDDVGVVPVPAFDNNPLYVSQGPTITFLKNPTVADSINDLQMRYAWQFAKFLTNPENNVDLCTLGSEGYIPVRYSAFDSDAYLEFLAEPSIYATSAKVLIEEIQGNYYNAPVFPGSSQLRDAVGNVIAYVLTGEKTANKALTDAIDQAKTYMK